MSIFWMFKYYDGYIMTTPFRVAYNSTAVGENVAFDVAEKHMGDAVRVEVTRIAVRDGSEIPKDLVVD